MALNFWQQLKQEKGDTAILALAPLAGFTDSVFRSVCKDFGADLVYSEMASVSGLHYDSQKTLKLLEFQEKERPYIVQLFGSNPEHFVSAVKFIEKELRPDGIDINFGCPVKKVLKQGAGSKLMSNLKLSREIIQRVLDNTSLPLSIKVRTEAFSVTLIDFLKNIIDLPVSALMIHGRTLNQLFSGPIDVEVIKQSRKYFSGIILANGGVKSLDEAQDLKKETGVDGVGIGRGALGRPSVFSDQYINLSPLEEKELSFKVALKHLKERQGKYGDISVNEFKGHLVWYFKDFPGAAELRSKLMLASTYDEMEDILLYLFPQK